MKNFNFTVPQNIMFGAGRVNEIPDVVKKVGAKKVFIVSDRGLEKAGIVPRLFKILDDANVPYESYLDVVANPTVKNVEESTAKYKDTNCDCIVAIGGGSPMDVAKATAVVSVYGGKVTDYESPAPIPGPIAPLIAIPTTAGTGSEVTSAAVITDTERNWKFSLFDAKLLPLYAILDPELITGLPFAVAASTGCDAIVHAVEAYISLAATPYTDALAEKAMELLGGNIRKFCANRKDIEAASNMLLGSTFAGMSFAWARLGNVHAMSHPVSAHFGVAHGVANSILLNPNLKYNALYADAKYEKIYRLLKKHPEKQDSYFDDEMLYDEIEELLIDLNIPLRLRDVGVTEDKFDVMSDDSLRSGNCKVNPRTPNKQDFINIYKSAF